MSRFSSFTSIVLSGGLALGAMVCPSGRAQSCSDIVFTASTLDFQTDYLPRELSGFFPYVLQGSGAAKKYTTETWGGTATIDTPGCGCSETYNGVKYEGAWVFNTTDFSDSSSKTISYTKHGCVEGTGSSTALKVGLGQGGLVPNPTSISAFAKTAHYEAPPDYTCGPYTIFSYTDVGESLSTEFTLQNAIDRAEAHKTTTQHTGGLQYWNNNSPATQDQAATMSRTDPITCHAYRVSFSAKFDRICSPGDYMITCYYKRWPIGSPEPAGYTDTTTDDVEFRFPPYTYPAQGSGMQLYPFPLKQGWQCKLVKVTAQKGCDNEPPGGFWFTDGSVEAKFYLGKRANVATTAGSLEIQSDNVTPALYSPAGLLSASSSDVGSVQQNGLLRQVNAPETFVDIVTTGDSSYELRYYYPSQVGAVDAGTGLYALSGQPFVTYVIDNPDATGSGATNRLRITENRDGASKVTIYSDSNGTMEMSKGNGLRVEDLQTSTSGDDTTTLRTTKDASGHVASVTQEFQHNYPFGEKLPVSRVLDPNGAALTTTYAYYENASDGGAYGHLKQLVEPNGHWTQYWYDSQGRVTETRTQLGDSTLGSAANLNRDTLATYTTVADLDGDGLPENLTTTVESVKGVETSRRFELSYSANQTFGGQTVRVEKMITATVAGASWDATSNLVTLSRFVVGGVFDTKPVSELRPDGTLTVYQYDQGTSTLTTTEWNGAANTTQDGVVSGSKTVTVTDLFGHLTSKTVTDVESQLTLSTQVVTTTDSLGRPTRIDYGDGTFETMSYACCGLESQTDRQGIATNYTYDAIGRVIATTRQGITTLSGLDADGRTLTTTRQGSDGSSIVQETLTYDLAGRLASRTDALARATHYTETIANGDTTKTTTNPDGGTRIEVSAADGTLTSVGGTAAAATSYTYGADTDGAYTQEVHLGSSGATTEWIKNYTDIAGRAYKTVYPDGTTAQTFYNPLGQQSKSVDPDGIATLYAYNARGEQETTAIDANNNGVIDYAGDDRITRTVRQVTTHGSTVVQRATTTVWAGSGQDVASTVSVDDEGVTGFSSWQTTNGLLTTSTTTYDGNGGRTVTSTAPDGVQTVQVYANDRLVSATVTTSAGTQISGVTYAYDPHGRLSSTTDARNGATTYTYFDDDQVHTVTTPDPELTRSGDGYDPQTTTYGYDSAGRQNTVTQPDGAVTTTTYYPSGQVQRVSGARTYPVQYSYDAQNRLKTLTTWQNYAGNSGQATTTWNYDAQRGWLSSKTYADGNGPNYTYTAAGRLKTRTWARGITTTYGYDALGSMTSTSYSNGDAGVALTYDRLGRLVTKTDATGSCTYAYQDLTTAITSETHTAGLLSGVTVTRGFDALHRPSSLGEQLAGDSSHSYAVSYGYDGASRLQTVTSGANTATYAYATNSSLVASLTFANSGNTRLTTTKAYDNLNRLTAINNTPGSPAAALNYAYTYNNANQRTRVTHEDNAYWKYTYDSLGQVTNGSKFLANDTGALGLAYAYNYDDIGNRTSTTTNGQSSTYSANSLNQYTQRTVPPSLDVLGAAAADATVTVNGQSTQRQGENFYANLSYANTVRPIWAELDVGATRNGNTTTQVRHAWLPNNESFSYDADGNLTADAQWTYAWDAENRLISMETRPDILPPSGPFPLTQRRRLDFAYDALGRRIDKKVSTWSPSGWHLISELRFVYDSWNLIAEYSVAPGTNNLTLVRSYTWGLDLSGSLQDAGGVGGLISITDVSLQVTGFAAFDGNGNVGGVASATDGTLLARYEYDVFGQTITVDGASLAFAGHNPFGFSTKYTDSESGDIYYGFRYYKLSVGRWLSRDPIEEDGGANLYGFVGNNPINAFDPNGDAAITFNVTYDDTYRGNVVKEARQLKSRLERKLADCCKQFKKACGVTVVMNFSKVVLVPRPKGGYDTSKDLAKVTKYLDSSAGIPVVYTDIVNDKKTNVAGAGIPMGLVLGSNAEDVTGVHEIGHVAGVRYPVPQDKRPPNRDGSPLPYDPQYDPKHNPDSRYLMYYTDNSGKVDCEYCSKLEALAK